MSKHFFVHVVESPSADDMFYGQFEGRVLYEALCTSRIDADYLLSADIETFFRAVGDHLLNRIAADNYQRWPVLHISAHGTPHGIQLTSREFLPWHILAGYFRALNRLLNGNLLLSMSSCHGYFACQTALTHDDAPFYAMVGPCDQVELRDLAIGFSAFYHVLSKTWDLAQAHRAMRTAAHTDSFMLVETAIFRKGFEEWSLQKRINEALQQMKTQGVPEAPDTPPVSDSSSQNPTP